FSRDWSSDVCSSDLRRRRSSQDTLLFQFSMVLREAEMGLRRHPVLIRTPGAARSLIATRLLQAAAIAFLAAPIPAGAQALRVLRSEERRVGKGRRWR